MTAVRERVIEDMRIRNLARNTQISYLQQVSLLARYSASRPTFWAGRRFVLIRSISPKRKSYLLGPSPLLCRLCVSCTSHTSPRMEFGGNHPRPQAVTETTCHSQSPGGT
jgi:hypothetical protein